MGKRAVRVRRLLRGWPVAVVALGGLVLAYALWPARYTFTVSPETTFVTSPLDTQGYVDYPTALNTRLSQGVTPDNNANVLVWHALGRRPEGGTSPPEYFQWLGIPSPPDDGEYLIGWDKYFAANLQNPPVDVLGLIEDDSPADWRQHWTDRVDRTRNWPWRRGDEPVIAAWLTINEKPLVLVAEASHRPEYFNPLVSKSSDPGKFRLLGSLLPSVQKCREAGNLLRCRAMARLAEGDDEGAWQDLITIQRLGRLVARGGTLIEQLVGFALVALATSAEVTVLGYRDHSVEQLQRWMEDLKRLPPMPSVADKLALGERMFGLDSLQSIVVSGPEAVEWMDTRGPAKSRKSVWTRMVRPSIDFDPAFRKMNEMYDRCEAACRLPDRPGRELAFAEINGDILQRRRTALSDCPISGVQAAV